MNLKKFCILFAIEDAAVSYIKYEKDNLIIKIKSSVYQTAMGNGIRDEKEEEYVITYTFHQIVFKDIYDFSKIEYIESTSFENDLCVLKTNRGEVLFDCLEVMVG